MATFLNTERDLASLLTRIRKKRGLTQEQLAKLIGVSVRRISQIESGKHPPKVSTLIMILDAMGLRLAITPKDPQ